MKRNACHALGGREQQLHRRFLDKFSFENESWLLFMMAEAKIYLFVCEDFAPRFVIWIYSRRCPYCAPVVHQKTGRMTGIMTSDVASGGTERSGMVKP